MYVKSLGFAIVLAMLLLVPASSYPQANSNSKVDDMIATAPNESIVILEEEETDIPGYVHTRYAFVDRACGTMLVDRYGPSIDPNDKAQKQEEERRCQEIAPGRPDGDSD
jgi:hypothetical protein